MVDWRLAIGFKSNSLRRRIGAKHLFPLITNRDVSAALSNQQNPAPVYGAHKHTLMRTHTSVFVLWMCKPKSAGAETVKAVNVVKKINQ